MISLSLEVAGATAELRPECGGTVDRLALAPEAGAEVVELLAGQSAGRQEGCEPGLFRGRLLAPFCDRIPGGRYELLGEHHELPINDWENGDAIHGFLYAQPMRVAGRGATSVLLEHQTTGEFPGYPFELALQARYDLEPSRFRLTLTAQNVSETPAPLTLGWHPYFMLPGVQRVDELRLQVPAERYIAVDERLLPTGEMPQLEGSRWDFSSPREIGSQAIDLGYPLAGSRITLLGPRHTMSMEVSGAFRYCQLFVPPDRRSIAIEPITGATDAFNNPELGLTILDPGEAITGECLITLQ